MKALVKELIFKRIEPCWLCVLEKEYKFKKHVIEFHLAVLESMGCGDLHIKEVEKVLMDDLEKEFNRPCI